jgi:hypothetical protein
MQEWVNNNLIQMAVYIFGTGILYARLEIVIKDVLKIERTLFGDDGRNGVVGDVHVVTEHIKRCKENQK